MGRRLGLVYGNLDARGRVLDVDGLQNMIASVLVLGVRVYPCLFVGQTGVLVRVEVAEVTLLQ